MTTTMIALIGEQPIPNILPVLHYKPERVLLVFTERTQRVAKRLQKLLSNAVVMDEPVQAYNIADTELLLQSWIDTNVTQDETVVFNITGGTKLMSLPAYRLAEKMGSPFLYLETGRRNIVYTYHFSSEKIPSITEEIELPELIDIDTYLRAHVDTYAKGGYSREPKGAKFEKAIHEALDTEVDEVFTSVKLHGSTPEVDLVVRIGNRVGIIETKVGEAVKKAIDQLNTAGGREYLGTFTVKFLVMGTEWNPQHTNLRALAEARQINVIELPGYNEDSGVLAPEDQQKLIKAIRDKL
jgi:hypothetical protein